MAHVTAAFGMGLPEVSRTTARIFKVRPTRTWESSDRMWTMAGVWAKAGIAARRRATDLRKDFLHRAEAAFACAVDVVEAPARRSVVDRLCPIDSQRGVDRGRDVVRIDRAIRAPACIRDGAAGRIACADDAAAPYTA